jgi:hypothetical protein
MFSKITKEIHMNKTATTKQDLERLAYLLHIIVDGHFVEGAVGNESAYACAALAREYVNRMGNHDHDGGMIAFFEANPEFVPMMFPDDGTVEKQMGQLKDTREMLGRPYPPPQHELMMMQRRMKLGPRPL